VNAEKKRETDEEQSHSNLNGGGNETEVSLKSNVPRNLNIHPGGAGSARGNTG